MWRGLLAMLFASTLRKGYIRAVSVFGEGFTELGLWTKF